MVGRRAALGLIAVIALVLGVAYFRPAAYRRVQKVALVSASNAVFHEAVREAFVELAEGRARERIEVQLITIPRVEDSMNVLAICQEALTLGADCIVVIGRAISTTLVNLARKRGCKVPIVFAGVQNPVELGLIASLEQPDSIVTGVMMAPSESSVPARLLHGAFPSVKSVLLPFCFSLDAAGEISGKIDAAHNYFESQGMKVTVLPLDSLGDSLQRIEVLLPSYDAVMTVEGDVINDLQFSGLAKLAHRQGVGYFSGIMNAAKDNVLAVYAANLRYIAEAGLEKVLEILKNPHDTRSFAVKFLGSVRDFIIDRKRAEELGYAVDLESIMGAIDADPFLGCARGRVKII